MSENEKNDFDGSIYTVGGGLFNPFEPDERLITLQQIAYGLAHTGRFNGQTKSFLSVAEHSCNVAMAVDEKHQLAALFHDAAEAYLGDIVRPHKRRMYLNVSRDPDLGDFKTFEQVEERLRRAIFRRFGIPPELPEEVKAADAAEFEREYTEHVIGDYPTMSPEFARRHWFQCVERFQAREPFYVG